MIFFVHASYIVNRKSSRNSSRNVIPVIGGVTIEAIISRRAHLMALAAACRRPARAISIHPPPAGVLIGKGGAHLKTAISGE